MVWSQRSSGQSPKVRLIKRSLLFSAFVLFAASCGSEIHSADAQRTAPYTERQVIGAFATGGIRLQKVMTTRQDVLLIDPTRTPAYGYQLPRTESRQASVEYLIFVGNGQNQTQLGNLVVTYSGDARRAVEAALGHLR